MEEKFQAIKTHSDLKKLLKYLEEQGFGYFSEWEYHQKKVDFIISKNNTLHIAYEENLKEKLYKLEDYNNIDDEAKKFFSKFNVDDKILELIKTFRLNEDDSCSTPWGSPSNAKEIIYWNNFKKKYNLKDEFGVHNTIRYYNLDKNFLKIYFPQYSTYEFKSLYKYIFGEDCNEFTDKKSGIWIDLGKIEIKFFMKGGANIKGDLKKMKEYFYMELTNKIYYHTLIKYNGKQEIFKSIRKDD